MLSRHKAVICLGLLAVVGCAALPTGPTEPVTSVRILQVKEPRKLQPTPTVDAEPIADPASSAERCKIYSSLIFDYSNSTHEILINPRFKDLSVAVWRSHFEANLNQHSYACLAVMQDVLFQNRSQLNDFSKKHLDAVILDIKKSTTGHLLDYHARLVDRALKAATRVSTEACEDELKFMDNLIGKGVLEIGDQAFDLRAINLTGCFIAKRGIP